MTQKLQASDLPIHKVTVYANSRAELLRRFPVTLHEGRNELVVEGVSSSIHSDSIRVDGRGVAIILEVQYKQKRKKLDKSDTDTVENTAQERKLAEEKLRDELERVETELSEATTLKEVCEKKALHWIR